MMASSSIPRCLRQVSTCSSRSTVIATRFLAASASNNSTNADSAATTAEARLQGEKPRASTPVRFNAMFRRQSKGKRQPRASNPKPHRPQKVRSALEQIKESGAKAKDRSRKDQGQKRQGVPDLGFPSTSWVQVNNIPILANLDDVLDSVNKVLDFERERGIINLDAEKWEETQPLPLLELEDKQEWVISARLVLSTCYRPNAWRLEFANRSIAHALLQHAERHAFLCAWKLVSVMEWNHEPDESEEKNQMGPHLERISDATIRFENCAEFTTVGQVRHLLRRYDLSMEPPSVVKLRRFTNDIVFIVHFEDASWARAAVRELQGVVMHDREVRLCQYPKQLP